MKICCKKFYQSNLLSELAKKYYVNLKISIFLTHTCTHNYSPDLVHAAAAAAMAGTDLEDGNIDIKFLNAYSNLEDAVSKVRYN